MSSSSPEAQAKQQNQQHPRLSPWLPKPPGAVQQALAGPEPTANDQGPPGAEAHRFDPLWIEDPLSPENNVGRNCFRIRQIQRMFAEAFDSLGTGGPQGLTLEGSGSAAGAAEV